MLTNVMRNNDCAPTRATIACDVAVVLKFQKWILKQLEVFRSRTLMEELSICSSVPVSYPTNVTKRSRATISRDFYQAAARPMIEVDRYLSSLTFNAFR